MSGLYAFCAALCAGLSAWNVSVYIDRSQPLNLIAAVWCGVFALYHLARSVSA